MLLIRPGLHQDIYIYMWLTPEGYTDTFHRVDAVMSEQPVNELQPGLASDQLEVVHEGDTVKESLICERERE